MCSLGKSEIQQEFGVIGLSDSASADPELIRSESRNVHECLSCAAPVHHTYVLASSCAPESGECNVTDRPTTCGDPPGRWGVMSPPGGSPHSVMPHVGPRWGWPHGCDAQGVNDLPPCAGYRIYHMCLACDCFAWATCMCKCSHGARGGLRVNMRK